MKIIKKLLVIFFLCCGGVVFAQSYQIGDVYTAPDGSRGIVYYLHPDGSGGWIVALNDASTGCTWGASTDVPGLANQNPSSYQQLLNDTAGYANTQTLRNYQNNSTTYAAGKVDFAHGWVLPSPAQLSMLYGQLPFIASSITGAGGTALASANYWSSAEKDASNAWYVTFNTGYFISNTKTTSCRVRAVRSFSNMAVVYDTSLTYQWSTGSTQPYINVSPAQTTTYTVTGTTEFGCSSTAEQTVIVGTDAAQTIYDTVCQGAGYEANGFTITEAETGTAGTLTRSRTLTTAGCSSTLTLRLMVKSPVAELVEATGCGSYIWNGVTYYESGDYTQTFTAANGCDSVVTLHLTVNSPVHQSLSITACESYTWTSGNGQTYTTSGDYTYAHTDANGCTQVDTLHLTLLPPLQVTVTVSNDTVCEGDAVTLDAVVLNADDFIAPSTPAVAVGDILCTDGTTVKPSEFSSSGKTAMGVVFYVDNTGEHGWAMHLQDQGTDVQWSPIGQYADIPMLTNYSEPRDAIMDLDGYSNTQNIRNAGPATQYPAAYAVDFANGWYLPALGQIRLIFSEMVTLNTSLQVVGGTQFPMNNYYYYWSSTEESSPFAWNVSYGGSMGSYGKGFNHRVRSIRNF